MTSTRIGDQVRALREEQGLTMTELAEKANVTIAAVSYIERNLRSPSSDTIEKIARALGVSPGELFPKAEAPLV